MRGISTLNRNNIGSLVSLLAFRPPDAGTMKPDGPGFQNMECISFIKRAV
ncbi:hypothetical protein FVEN_g13135 [Fusarium venenatum]|nr:hypothetical protein FVEN_g13135 [Fusarium venenatum]